MSITYKKKILPWSITFFWCLGVLFPTQGVSQGSTCTELDSLKKIGVPAVQFFAKPFEHTVTNISPGWFNLENVASASAPVFFQIQINPSLRARAANGQLHLGVYIVADPINNRLTDQTYVMVDELYRVEEQHVGGLITSGEVFNMDKASDGQSSTEAQLEELLAVGGGKAPSMDLKTQLKLTCDHTTVTAWEKLRIEAEGAGTFDVNKPANLRNVENIKALSPGSRTSSRSPAEIYEFAPTFIITSDLYGEEFDYGPDPKFTLFIYEVVPGERSVEALSGVELLSFDVFGKEGKGNSSIPAPYPSYAPLLEAGKTYVWRVRANLRGPSVDYMYSNALQFKVSTLLGGGDAGLERPGLATDVPNFVSEKKHIDGFLSSTDDYNKRLMAALKIILGENYDIFVSSLGDKAPIKGHIRWNGQPFSLEQIEKLAKEFLKDKHTLTRLHFQ